MRGRESAAGPGAVATLAIVTVYSELQQHEEEKADADDAVDVEKGLVDPAQVVGPHQPVLVGE